MNNKGYGKFEVLTILVLLIVIVAVLLMTILKSVDNQKLNVMVTNAKNFSNKVIAGDASGYYLRDAIEDGIYDNIRSPFSTNNCDVDESKVEFEGSKKYVTLKCDNYIIYHEEAINDTYKIYTISKWSDSKNSDDYQKIVGYNCEKDKKNVFDTYYEQKVFLSHINELYKKEYSDEKEITECNIVTKELYRDLTLVR